MARSCKMTKMHFQLIADTILDLDLSSWVNMGSDGEVLRQEIAENFANVLHCTNPKFDREKFIEAATNMDRLDR
jgi:hypothetical protein